MASDVTRIQRGFATRQELTPEQKEAKLRDVADMYEKHFLREMVKSMRSTVSEGGLIPTNAAEKIFREQLDEQYVENWSKKGGVGLADMIQDQLMQKFGEQMGIRFPTVKPRGPITLDAKTKQMLKDGVDAAPAVRNEGTSSRVGFRAKADSAQKSIQFALTDADQLTREVAPPWSGSLSQIEQSPEGEQLLGVEHGNGFRSLLRFRGELVSNLRPGPVEAGQPLGTWDSGRGDMNWTLEFRPDPKSE